MSFRFKSTFTIVFCGAQTQITSSSKTTSANTVTFLWIEWDVVTEKATLFSNVRRQKNKGHLKMRKVRVLGPAQNMKVKSKFYWFYCLQHKLIKLRLCLYILKAKFDIFQKAWVYHCKTLTFWSKNYSCKLPNFLFNILPLSFCQLWKRFS